MRLRAAVLTVSLAALLAACGGSKATPTPVPATPAPATGAPAASEPAPEASETAGESEDGEGSVAPTTSMVPAAINATLAALQS